jgi:hypothetical protein
MDVLLRHAVVLVLGFAAGMFVCLELGRRLGVRRLADDPSGKEIGLGAVEGAVFGLFGLLIAFTFQGAAERFNDRRALIAEEANAIGTAWLRVDLLPEAAQPGMRRRFRDYLDSRFRTYEPTADNEIRLENYRLDQELQERIWDEAVAGCRDMPPPCSIVLLPAINAMIDITTTRLMATRQHPPAVIFLMLMVLALGCSVLAGYGMAGTRRRAWAHMILFAVTVAFAVFVIIDMEYPRLGFIRVDQADQVLIDLRKSMD